MNINDNPHSLSYPDPEGVMPDPMLARLTERAFYEELACISTYIYYTILTEQADAELARLFEDLALDEMKHFNLLGKTILALGRNPIINTRLRVAPAEPTATRDCRGRRKETVRLLQTSIAREGASVEEYERLSGQTGDSVYRAILARILFDERRHLARLQEVLSDMQRNME